MNVKALILEYESYGVEFSLSGSDLVIRGNKKTINDNISFLNDHKDVIKKHLTKHNLEHYQYFYDERAAIYEYDAGWKREIAEEKAYNDTIEEWIYNNPPIGYNSTTCAYCGTALDFRNSPTISCRNISCCYESEIDNHLNHYIKSRWQEADKNLLSLGIKKGETHDR
jgi:hypothetical protein